MEALKQSDVLENVQVIESVEEETQQQITHCNIIITLPNQQTIKISAVSCNETLLNIKLSLQEYVEVCAYTSYNFAINYKGLDDNVYNEYTEVTTLLFDYINTITQRQTEEEINISELPLIIKIEVMDAKKARAQIKRVKDILFNPPSQYGTELPLANTNEKEELFIKAPKNVIYPTNDIVSSTAEVSLGQFYEETLYRISGQRDDPAEVTSEDLSFVLAHCVPQLSLSDFNPPPPQRQLQGDLTYVQVSFSDDLH